jgi:oligosaccharide repeat unit polymerase
VPRAGSAQRDPRLFRALDLVGFSFFGLCSCILLIACSTIGRWPASMGPEFLAGCALMAMSLHVLLASRRVSTVDPVIWIPVAFLVFYFGMPFARFLGAHIAYDAWSVPAPRNLARGFGVALLTLTSFIAGMYLHGIDDRRSPNRTAWPTSAFVGWAGLIVFAIGAASMLVGFVRAGPSLILGMYGEIYESKAVGVDFRLFDVGLILTKAGVIGLLVAHRPRRIVWDSIAITTALLILAISARLGDRGGLISFAFAVTWVYAQRIRRIPVWLLAIAGVVVVFLIPGIKEYRDTRSLAATLSLSPAQAASSTLYEAGTSVLTYAYTLDLIPSEKSYGWGISYLRAFLHLLPNLGLTPGKSFMPDVLEASPSQWLTARIHPAKYEQGGGYGYSVGAEWYFNFGMMGVLVGMIGMGYLLCFFRKKEQGGPLWMAWSALLFSMLELIVRNIIGAPLKAAMWSLFALWAVSGLLRKVVGSTPVALGARTTRERSGNAA